MPVNHNVSGNLNFFDTYIMMALVEDIVPRPSFFRDRYFPTEAGDVFASDKVLVEYRKGDRKIAPFVAERVGDIPMERTGYEIHEIQPAYIGMSRPLTADDLRQRGFGEAIYANSTPAERAAVLQRNDLADLERRIAGREEWMAVETMINNACTMQEYIDAKTIGGAKHVQFYGDTTNHTYTVANKWDGANGDFFGDVKAMCKLLAARGLPAADLVLGSDAADAVLEIEKVQKLLDKNSGIIVGQIDATLTQYPGVAYMGTLNFGGFRLNLIDVDETYENDNGVTTAFFPKTAAMVTAPACGHIMYGQISQIDYGSTEFVTYAASRVPKLIVDQPHDIRSLRLASRPIAAPKQYSPYIYAADVCG